MLKSFFITLVISGLVYAANESEISKQLSMSNCIPHRSSETGEIDRYICDDSQSRQVSATMEMTATMKDAKPTNFEYLGKMKKAEMRKVKTGEVDQTAQAQSFMDQLDAKIKSCLSFVYSSQTAYQKQNGEFTSDNAKLGIKNNSICSGLELQTEYSTTNEFKTIAKRGQLSWSVDNEKRMTKLY